MNVHYTYEYLIPKFLIKKITRYLIMNNVTPLIKNDDSMLLNKRNLDDKIKSSLENYFEAILFIEELFAFPNISGH